MYISPQESRDPLYWLLQSHAPCLIDMAKVSQHTISDVGPMTSRQVTLLRNQRCSNYRLDQTMRKSKLPLADLFYRSLNNVLVEGSPSLIFGNQ